MTPKLKIHNEQGIVAFPVSWNDFDRVAQLDLLQDWITELEKVYDSMLDSPLTDEEK